MLRMTFPPSDDCWFIAAARHFRCAAALMRCRSWRLSPQSRQQAQTDRALVTTFSETS
jgi:hypothetical protein